MYYGGIETPCVSATATFSEASIPECSFTVPYTRLFRGLGRGDRIQAAIFYLNDYREEPAWELLYDGELVSQDFAKNSEGQKQLTFVSVDHMQVLTQVFPHFVSTSKGIVRANTGVNNTSTLSTAPFPKTTTFFNNNLAFPSGERPKVKRPFDVAMNVVYTLLGLDKDTEDDRSIISKQWFSRWEARTAFTRRWIPSDNYNAEDDDWVFPILKAAQSESVLDALQKEGDRIASSSSYYVFLQYLFQRMYTTLTALPAPPALVADDGTNDLHGVYRHGDAQVEGKHIQLGQYLVKPRMFFGLVPRCNVLWGSVVRGVTYSENYALQPTRTYIGNAHMMRVNAKNKQAANSPQGLLANLALTSAYPEEADRQLRSQSNESNQDNYLIFPEEFFRGPVYNAGQTPSWFLMLANTQKGGNKDDALVKIYAKVEHFRKVGQSRHGQVRMIFNPYVLPGFPALIPSGSDDGDDLYVEVVSVTHTMTPSEVGTIVTFTNAQFVDEVMRNLILDRAKLPFEEQDDLAMAPMHPVKSMRERFQNLEQSDEYFNRVLYGDTQPGAAVADHFEMFSVKIGSGDAADVRELTREDALKYELLEEYPLVLSEGYRQFTDNTIAAMSYCERPVCTLEEYIDFYGDYGTRQGKVSAGADYDGKPLGYWIKILDLIQGPGPEPGHTSDGERCGTVVADTAQNWESRLLRIRDAVYYAEHPQKA